MRYSQWPGLLGGGPTESVPDDPDPPGDAYEVTTLTVTGTGAAAGTILRIGLPLAPADVPTGTTLLLRDSTTTAAWRTQVTEMTTRADDSVIWALAEVELPELADGETAALTLWGNDAHLVPGDPLDWATATSGRSASLTISADGGTPQVIDLLADADEDIAAGPLVIHKRGRVLLDSSAWGGLSCGMVGWDVWVDKAGAITVDPRIYNAAYDPPDASAGEAEGIAFALEIDGTELLAATGKSLANYAGFMRMVTTGDYWPAYVAHDPDYLTRCGLPRLDATNGYDTSKRAAWDASRAAPGWDAIMEQSSAGYVRDIDENMDATGGRPYIAPVSDAGAAWIMDGHPSAQRYAMDQAEALIAAPWNLWLRTEGRWINRVDRPGFLYLNAYSGFVPKYSATITDQPGYGTTGPGLTTAGFPHCPAVLFVPLLLKGRLGILDILQAKTTAAIAHCYDTTQPPGEEGEMVRERAWTDRDLDWCAACTPPGDPLHDFFRDTIAAQNTRRAAQIPGWIATRGEMAGYVVGEYEDNRKITPWQQAYYVSAVYQRWRLGYDVADLIDYLVEFTVACFQTLPDTDGTTQGFPLLATSYQLSYAATAWGGIGGATIYQTAQEMVEATNDLFGVQDPAAQDPATVKEVAATLEMLAEMRPADSRITAAIATMAATQHAALFDAAAFRGNPGWSIVRDGVTRA